MIGGGNVAIDVSRTAVRCGSSKISQVSLETRDIMPALPEEIEIAESEGIEFYGGWGPKEIVDAADRNLYRAKETGRNKVVY